MQPLHTTIIALLLSAGSALAGSAAADAISEPSGELKLAQAVALTLARNPQLEAFSWDRRIAEAGAMQAAARKNPELSVELENAAGSGSFRAADAAEETVSLSQTIELGRKREKRIAVAKHDVALAEKGFVLKRAEVLNAATKAFIAVLAAQEELAFSKQAQAMQRDLTEAQTTLAEAGKISAAETELGKAALALATIEVNNAEAELATARSALGAFWGNAKPRFRRAAGSIRTGSLPSMQSYENDLQQNPVLAYHGELIRRHRAAIDLEESQRTPDITLGVGARHFEDSDENAAVFSLSIPLPLFDRKQGEIARARAEAGKAEAESRSARSALEAAVVAGHLRLAAAHREAAALEKSGLPAAKRNHDFASEGYRLGKFSYLELKAAQDALLEAQQLLLRAQIRFLKTKADLDTLSGRTH